MVKVEDEFWAAATATADRATRRVFWRIANLCWVEKSR